MSRVLASQCSSGVIRSNFCAFINSLRASVRVPIFILTTCISMDECWLTNVALTASLFSSFLPWQDPMFLPMVGIEPTTFGLEVQCAIQLRHTGWCFFYFFLIIWSALSCMHGSHLKHFILHSLFRRHSILHLFRFLNHIIIAFAKNTTHIYF